MKTTGYEASGLYVNMGDQIQSVFFRFCEHSSQTMEGFSFLDIASSDSQRDI